MARAATATDLIVNTVFKNQKYGFRYIPNPKFIKNAKGFYDEPIVAVGAIVRRAVKNSIRVPTQSQIKKSIIGRKRLSKLGGTRPPSKVGTAPRTHKPRRILKNSIDFQADLTRNSVKIGQITSKRGIGDIALIHEIGMRTSKGRYPKRPFMKPALDRVIASGRIPKQFQNIL